MCRRSEVKERLSIMEGKGMISRRVSGFCMDAVDIILREKEDADAEKLCMLITHLAMAGDRMEKGNAKEAEISPEVLEEVRQEMFFPKACCISQRILGYDSLEFTKIEKDFLIIHLCNILT